MKKHNTIKVVLWIVTAIWLLSAIFLPDVNWAYLVKMGLTLVEFFLIIFNLKEKHNILKVVLVTLLGFMIITWILPAAYYSNSFIDQGRVQMGLFDLFKYPLTAVAYFGFIALFVVVLGGFYGVLYKIPAYRCFLDKIVAIFKGKESLFLSIVMVLIATLTSICGLQLGLLLFFPMIAAIILLLGYDKIVTALTLVGSVAVGFAGTTYAASNVSIIYQNLGLQITDNMLIKVSILVAGLILLIFNTLMYAKSVKLSKSTLIAEKKVIKTEDNKSAKEEVKVVLNDENKEKTESKKTTTKKTTKKPTTKTSSTKKSSTTKTAKKTTKTSSKSSKNDNKAATKGDDVIVVKESLVDESLDKFVPVVVDSKHKIWPFAVGFILLFIIMILAFIPWASVFKVSTFMDVTKAVSEFKLFGFEIFGKILGTVTPFGEWTIPDLLIVMALIVLILVFIYKVDFDDVIDGFIAGAKKAMKSAILVILVYTILVAVTYHPFQTTIYESLFGLTKSFNVVITSIVTFLSSLFNGDPMYVFQSIVPHFAGVITNAEVYPLASILIQSIFGVSTLVAPTSIILILVLNYLGVSYKDWFKSTWKFILELFVIILLLFTILILI